MGKTVQVRVLSWALFLSFVELFRFHLKPVSGCCFALSALSLQLRCMDDSKKNEGEGSKMADKKYRQGATEFAKRTDTLQVGEQAEREVEANKAQYEQAEKLGRSHSAGDLKDDLSGKGFDKK